MPIESGGADRLEEKLLRLLDATEALWAALADGSSVEAWDQFLAHRISAFGEFERACAAERRGEGAWSAAARTCLDRIAELDAAICQAGGEGLVRLRKEQLAIGNRRRAVLAHGLQPRETPRAVTVKA